MIQVCAGRDGYKRQKSDLNGRLSLSRISSFRLGQGDAGRRATRRMAEEKQQDLMFTVGLDSVTERNCSWTRPGRTAAAGVTVTAARRRRRHGDSEA